MVGEQIDPQLQHGFLSTRSWNRSVVVPPSLFHVSRSRKVHDLGRTLATSNKTQIVLSKDRNTIHVQIHPIVTCHGEVLVAR